MILRVNQVWQDSLRCSGPLERCSSATRKPVGEKILHVSESLGSIFRPTFQMSVAALPHAKLMRAIELLGTRVAPIVRTELTSGTGQQPLSANSCRAA